MVNEKVENAKKANEFGKLVKNIEVEFRDRNVGSVFYSPIWSCTVLKDSNGTETLSIVGDDLNELNDHYTTPGNHLTGVINYPMDTILSYRTWMSYEPLIEKEFWYEDNQVVVNPNYNFESGLIEKHLP